MTDGEDGEALRGPATDGQGKRSGPPRTRCRTAPSRRYGHQSDTHQIERKGACIEAQTGNLAELRRILALERENFARTTSGSTWAKSNDASNKALDLAISYLARAYSSAAAGSYATANSWLSKSNAQVAVSNRQVKIGNKAIDELNAASDAINEAADEFLKTLDETGSTCGD